MLLLLLQLDRMLLLGHSGQFRWKELMVRRRNVVLVVICQHGDVMADADARQDGLLLLLRVDQ